MSVWQWWVSAMIVLMMIQDWLLYKLYTNCRDRIDNYADKVEENIEEDSVA